MVSHRAVDQLNSWYSSINMSLIIVLINPPPTWTSPGCQITSGRPPVTSYDVRMLSHDIIIFLWSLPLKCIIMIMKHAMSDPTWTSPGRHMTSRRPPVTSLMSRRPPMTSRGRKPQRVVCRVYIRAGKPSRDTCVRPVRETRDGRVYVRVRNLEMVECTYGEGTPRWSSVQILSSVGTGENPDMVECTYGEGTPRGSYKLSCFFTDIQDVGQSSHPG